MSTQSMNSPDTFATPKVPLRVLPMEDAVLDKAMATAIEVRERNGQPIDATILRTRWAINCALTETGVSSVFTGRRM